MIESIILILCIIFAFIGSRILKLQSTTLIVYLIILIAAGIRAGVGTDTQTYLQLYSSIDDLNALKNTSPFYYFFYYLRTYFESPYTITFLVAMLQICVIVFIYKDYRYNNFLLIYFAFYLVSYSFNQVRQGLADLVGVLTIQNQFLSNRYFLSSLIIFMIHPISGIIRLITGIIKQGSIQKGLKHSVIIGSILLVIYFFQEDKSIFFRYIEYFQEHPDGYQEFKFYPYFYIKTLIIIVFLNYVEIGKYLTKKSCIFYLIIIIIVSYIPIITRAVDTLLIYLLAYSALNNKLNKDIPDKFLIIVLLIGMIGTLRFILKDIESESGCAKWLPYETFLNETECTL